MEKPRVVSNAPLAYNTVFIDTSLDTHMAIIVSDFDTVSDLKKKIMFEHLLCFPEIGEIKVHALRVKRKGFFYHLSDSMLVKSAFVGAKKNWFLSVVGAPQSSLVDKSEETLYITNKQSSDEPGKSSDDISAQGMHATNMNNQLNDKVVSLECDKSLGEASDFGAAKKRRKVEKENSGEDPSIDKKALVSNSNQDVPCKDTHLLGTNSTSGKRKRKTKLSGLHCQAIHVIPSSVKDNKEESFKGIKGIECKDPGKESEAESFLKQNVTNADPGALFLEEKQGPLDQELGEGNQQNVTNSRTQQEIGAPQSSPVDKSEETFNIMNKQSSDEPTISSNDISAQGMHATNMNNQLNDKVVSLECDKSLGEASNFGSAKKKRKVKRKSGGADPTKDKNALVSDPNEDNSREAGNTIPESSMDERQKITPEINDGSSIVHAQDAPFLGSNSTNGKRKRKTKSSGLHSQVIPVIPYSVKDNIEESSKGAKGIENRDPGKESAVESSLEKNVTNGDPGALSLEEKHGPLDQEVGEGIEHDIDAIEANPKNDGKKADEMRANEMESLQHIQNGKSQQKPKSVVKKVRKKTKKKHSSMEKQDDGVKDPTPSTGEINEGEPLDTKHNLIDQLSESGLLHEKDAKHETGSLHPQLISAPPNTCQLEISPSKPNAGANALIDEHTEPSNRTEVSNCESDTINFGDYFMASQNQQEVVSSAEARDDKVTEAKKSDKSKVKKNSKKVDLQSIGTIDLQNTLKSNENHGIKKKSRVGNLQKSLSKNASLEPNTYSDGKLFKVPGGRVEARSSNDNGKIKSTSVEERQTGVLKTAVTSCLDQALLKENAENFSASSSTSKTSVRKNEKKLDRHKMTASKKSGDSRRKAVNSTNHKKSLLAMPGNIFKDGNGESSADDSDDDSDASTRTPSDNSFASDHSEAEENSATPRKGPHDVNRKADKAQKNSSLKNVALDTILRGSSRFKKAKLTASQLEETESQPVDVVPDSQADL